MTAARTGKRARHRIVYRLEAAARSLAEAAELASDLGLGPEAAARDRATLADVAALLREMAATFEMPKRRPATASATTETGSPTAA